MQPASVGIVPTSIVSTSLGGCNLGVGCSPIQQGFQHRSPYAGANTLLASKFLPWRRMRLILFRLLPRHKRRPKAPRCRGAVISAALCTSPCTFGPYHRPERRRACGLYAASGNARLARCCLQERFTDIARFLRCATGPQRSGENTGCRNTAYSARSYGCMPDEIPNFARSASTPLE